MPNLEPLVLYDQDEYTIGILPLELGSLRRLEVSASDRALSAMALPAPDGAQSTQYGT